MAVADAVIILKYLMGALPDIGYEFCTLGCFDKQY